MAIRTIRTHDAMVIVMRHVDRARVETCLIIAATFDRIPDQSMTGAQVAEIVRGVAAGYQEFASGDNPLPPRVD